MEDPQESNNGTIDHAEEQMFLTLSVAAVPGIPLPRAMCFWGQLGTQHIRILLDSRSSHTFISSAVVAQFNSLQKLSSPLWVQVANGQLVQCSSHIPAATWSIQQCQFTSDLKVLPLSSYDMILGLDWLEGHSPMEIHWTQKWIQLPYQGTSV